MKKTLYEKLKEISSLKTKALRIETYRKLDDKFLHIVADVTYNPNYIWLIPSEVPPYKPAVDRGGDLTMLLTQELRRIGIFISGSGYDNMKQFQRENHFITMLSSVHPDDAKLLLAMVSRKLPFANLDKKFFEEAVPQFKTKWEKKG